MLGRPGGCALRFGFCLELLKSRLLGLPGVPLQGERVLGFFVVLFSSLPPTPVPTTAQLSSKPPPGRGREFSPEAGESVSLD